MKFLVVGGGSMGKRRIRCLQAHYVRNENIRLIDTRDDRRAESKEKYGVDSFELFQQGMDWAPDVVIVSVPSRLHMKYCLEAARAGKDFWCEIGLSHNLDDTDELMSLVTQKKLVAALGIQTPYHPLFQQAKQWLSDPEFGRPLIYRFDWGNYLPNWHPWEDYRDFYDETQIMGVIAEDLGQLYSFLHDSLTEVTCRMSHMSSLEIEGPDCVQLIAKTKKGTAVTMQFDLMQDTQHVEYRIVSESGVIELSIYPRTFVRRYLNSTGKFESYLLPKGYQYEQCYIDEFGAFLGAVKDRVPWHHPLSDGIHILKCLEAITQSNREGRTILVGEPAPKTG